MIKQRATLLHFTHIALGFFGLVFSATLFAQPLSPQAIQALENLDAIVLPEPVGWWPLAFAWWILLLSAVSLLIGISWYFLDQKRRNAYRKQALKQLQQIEQSALSDSEKIQSINRLLKTVAITAYGRRRVAALHHQAWVEFLQQTANYIQQPKHLQTIFNLGYSENSATTEHYRICLEYTQKWIKGHHQ